MKDSEEKIIIGELSEIFGREYAELLLDLEKEDTDGDATKTLGKLRNLMVKAGGRSFGELVYTRIQKKLKELPDA